MRKNNTIIFVLLALNITCASAALPTENQNAFSLTDICKAGLATMYGRDVSIMNAQPVSDQVVRIRYTRPQDGKVFSYLCRKESASRLSTLDESLTGARWYGADLADTQLFFSATDDALIVRDVAAGKVLKENIYTKNHFRGPDAQSIKKTDDGINWLNEYGKKIASQSQKRSVQYINAERTMRDPVNVYMLNFNTSDKKLLTIPGAGTNKSAYDKNILRITEWEKSFCTQQLNDYMADHNINIVHSQISHNGKRQFTASCFIQR